MKPAFVRPRTPGAAARRRAYQRPAAPPPSLPPSLRPARGPQAAVGPEAARPRVAAATAGPAGRLPPCPACPAPRGAAGKGTPPHHHPAPPGEAECAHCRSPVRLSKPAAPASASCPLSSLKPGKAQAARPRLSPEAAAQPRARQQGAGSRPLSACFHFCAPARLKRCFKHCCPFSPQPNAAQRRFANATGGLAQKSRLQRFFALF